MGKKLVGQEAAQAIGANGKYATPEGPKLNGALTKPN
jgi:hypothetical protein